MSLSIVLYHAVFYPRFGPAKECAWIIQTSFVFENCLGAKKTKNLGPQRRLGIHALRLTGSTACSICHKIAACTHTRSCLHYATEILFAAGPVGALMPTTAVNAFMNH